MSEENFDLDKTLPFILDKNFVFDFSFTMLKHNCLAKKWFYENFPYGEYYDNVVEKAFMCNVKEYIADLMYSILSFHNKVRFGMCILEAVVKSNNITDERIKTCISVLSIIITERIPSRGYVYHSDKNKDIGDGLEILLDLFAQNIYDVVCEGKFIYLTQSFVKFIYERVCGGASDDLLNIIFNELELIDKKHYLEIMQQAKCLYLEQCFGLSIEDN